MSIVIFEMYNKPAQLKYFNRTSLL